jgi:hypothetical protein
VVYLVGGLTGIVGKMKFIFMFGYNFSHPCRSFSRFAVLATAHGV